MRIAIAIVLTMLVSGDLLAQERPLAFRSDPIPWPASVAAFAPPQEADGGDVPFGVLIGMPLGVGALWYLLCDDSADEEYDYDSDNDSDSTDDECLSEASIFAGVMFLILLAVDMGLDPDEFLPGASPFVRASTIPQATDFGFRIPIGQ